MKKIVLGFLKYLNKKDEFVFKWIYLIIGILILVLFLEIVFKPYAPKKNFTYVDFEDNKNENYTCFVVETPTKIFKKGVYCYFDLRLFLMSENPDYFETLLDKIKSNNFKIYDYVKVKNENKN